MVVSSETQRLIARTFECEALGARPIKGLPGPEPVYRVIGERAADADIAPSGRPAAILGREHELKLLLDRWEQARQGTGRVVCISGDPGIGKSHLIHELKSRAALVSCRMLDARCLPYQRNTAFHPFVELLQRELNLRPDQTGEAQLSALADELQRHDLATDDALPLLAGLLSIQADYTRPVEPPALTKERTKALLVQLLLTVVVVAILYSSGETVVRGVVRFARRLAGAQGETAVRLAARAVRAVALGVVVTAIVQAALAGIGLAVVGVPLASILTVLIFILAVAQIGAAPVLIPATIWVYSTSGAVWGTAFLVWSMWPSGKPLLRRPPKSRPDEEPPQRVLKA